MSLLTLPGLIDPHVHLRDPEQTHKEDFYTGTCAAISGGYTTVLDMPNNKTPITTIDRLEEKIKIAKEKIVCDTGFYFGSLGDNLEEFGKVTKKVMGLKLYLNETTGNFLIDKEKLQQIFTTWQKTNKTPILLHAEDEAVEYVIKLVTSLKTRIHFCHISTKKDLEQIIEAKEKNLPVTCGVTPHHLFLTEHDAKILGPFGKMKPSLKSQKDVEFLWKHIKVIDVVESDHAPHTIEEKNNNSPFGVPGIETTLPLLLTAVSENRLNLEDVIRLCHQNSAKIFNIPTSPQTKIEVDLSTSYVIENKNLHTKCGWSPFNGFKVKGKLKKVLLRGKNVYKNDIIFANPGSGDIIS